MRFESRDSKVAFCIIRVRFGNGDSESIFRDAILLRFDSFFAPRCGISGDSRPAIRDSVSLRFEHKSALGCPAPWTAYTETMHVFGLVLRSLRAKDSLIHLVRPSSISEALSAPNRAI